MLSRCFFDFSAGLGAFVIRLSQISFLFLLINLRSVYAVRYCKQIVSD